MGFFPFRSHVLNARVSSSSHRSLVPLVVATDDDATSCVRWTSKIGVGS